MMQGAMGPLLITVIVVGLMAGVGFVSEMTAVSASSTTASLTTVNTAVAVVCPSGIVTDDMQSVMT